MSFPWFERRQKCKELEALPLKVEIEEARARIAYLRDLSFGIAGIAVCALAWFFISPWVDSLIGA